MPTLAEIARAAHTAGLNAEEVWDTFDKVLGGHTEHQLRDYFAAEAPPPPTWWMESYKKALTDLDKVAEHISQWNYTYADAMLAARSK